MCCWLQASVAALACIGPASVGWLHLIIDGVSTTDSNASAGLHHTSLRPVSSVGVEALPGGSSSRSQVVVLTARALACLAWEHLVRR